MGLTFKSSEFDSMKDIYEIKKKEGQFIVALAGNPNTGKSTVFNSLTGLHQHTGNWPGKTVVNARGEYNYGGEEFILVDLPGTYSLFSSSVEEEVARDFICFGNHDAVIVVADATCLERNLNLVFQVMELTDNVILCINLIDEAKKKNIIIDGQGIEKELGIPVVMCAARSNLGMNELKEKVYKVSNKKIKPKPKTVKYQEYIEEKIREVQPYIENDFQNINSRWLALRMIDGDEKLIKSIIDKTDQEVIEDIHNIKIEEEVVEDIHNINVEERALVNDEVEVENNNDIEEETLVNEEAEVENTNTVRSETNEQESETNEQGPETNEQDSVVRIRDDISQQIYKRAEEVTDKYVGVDKAKLDRDRKTDDIVTSKRYGIPLMILLLVVILWITIVGANYPSQLLSDFLFGIGDKISGIFVRLNAPAWLHGVLVDGLFTTVAWVVAVMLPPMAIFFPLFTLLEDLGYLPRVALNMDHYFKKACAHGKQCLTMCMGFGCNAAGVISCRIIDSPRERLIAIITNNFVPCNGRFPTLIALSTIAFGAMGGVAAGILPVLSVVGLILIGVIITLLVSYGLSKTVLKGVPSSFTLELPPYRRPQIGRVLYSSIIDRTIFVLGRAIKTAAPAGVITWIFANVYIGDLSIIGHVAGFLDPFAQMIGLDGFILMAFILGLPANEIVLPVLIMSYLETGVMIEFESLSTLKTLLIDNGWTMLTVLNTMLFSLLHWPCATTLLTIKKETNSTKWTVLSAVIPTVIGIALCFVTTTVFKLFAS